MELLNPLSLIKRDHDKVNSMLKDYMGMDYLEKGKLTEKIAEELAIHMEMEEQLFYPDLKNTSTDASGLVEEGLKEHNEIRDHIGGALKAGSEEELDEHVAKMEKIIKDHVGEEEGEMFGVAEEKLKGDFAKMTAKMEAFKAKEKGATLLEKLKQRL